MARGHIFITVLALTLAARYSLAVIVRQLPFLRTAITSVEDGLEEHIVLTEHMNLLQHEDVYGVISTLVLPSSLKSFTGACNSPVPDDFPPLTVDLLPGQCVVVLPNPQDFDIRWESDEASLWLHNIYFLVQPEPVVADSDLGTLFKAWTTLEYDTVRLWVTNSTFQGGSFDGTGLDVGPMGVYMKGVTFDSFHPSGRQNFVLGNDGGRKGDLILNGTTVLENCTFSRNKGNIIDIDYGYAKLQGVSFSNNTGEDEGGKARLVRYRGTGATAFGAQKVVFSDEEIPVYKYVEDLEHFSSPLSEIPPAAAARMLTLEDTWLLQTMQERDDDLASAGVATGSVSTTANPATSPATDSTDPVSTEAAGTPAEAGSAGGDGASDASPPADGTESSSSTSPSKSNRSLAPIIGASVGAAMLLLIALALSLYFCRKRKLSQPAATMSDKHEAHAFAPPSIPTSAPPPESTGYPHHSSYNASHSSGEAPYKPQLQMQSQHEYNTGAKVQQGMGVAAGYRAATGPNAVSDTETVQFSDNGSCFSGRTGRGPAATPLEVASTAATTTKTSSTGEPGTWTLQTLPGVQGGVGGTGGAVATGASQEAVEVAREKLEVELDTLRGNKELFLGTYEVLSAMERRSGGQGLVQFVRAVNSEEAFAVKFFFKSAAFDAEVALYQDPVLRGMMPATRGFVGNDARDVCAASGYAWPPCIIIERGESLQEWRKRENEDFITTLQVLYHVAQRLSDLHRSGWAHLDLKPGNVLRRPRHHSWTLIDFGCAAKIGMEVPITYTLAYMPPEVAIAVKRGDRTIRSDPAADVWALGVIAYELLTGTALLPPLVAPQNDAWRQLLGKALLPWEAGSEGATERLSQLRALKRGVLACLERDPKDRPTSDSVLTTWTHIFDTQTRTRTEVLQ